MLRDDRRSVFRLSFTKVTCMLVLSACGRFGGGEKKSSEVPSDQDASEISDAAIDNPDLAMVRGEGQNLESSILPNLLPFSNPRGAAATLSKDGHIDLNSAFFESFGTNGRSCGSCHDPRAGWTITPQLAKFRFQRTDGLDPLFRTNDGSVSPNANVKNVAARRRAYRMILNKGLIRIGLPIPQNAEFALVRIQDPYHFASAKELSLFRRPLPSTNLSFLPLVMWDGRESNPGLDLVQSLKNQANTATKGHAQGVGLSDEQQQRIVDFELALFSAQIKDRAAGKLDAAGARGGPVFLAEQPFQIGINDPTNPTTFNPNVFTLFGEWAGHGQKGAIARGEQIFNLKKFTVRGVRGFNDVIGVPAIESTCSSCHNTPNVGNLSIPAMQDIGISDGARRTADLPLYTLRNTSTGEVIKVTDPGRALTTGKWADIGLFKVPTLRDLAARPPYFHNGSAKDLADVVEFYDQRFQIGFTPQEERDLRAFLGSL